LNAQDLLKQTKAEARPYQIRILEKIFDKFYTHKLRSVLLESPTGSGKTIMALLIAKALHDELGLNIGWVAMRKHLLTQAEEENIAKGVNVPITFISMFDKDPQAKIISPNGELDVLIVDEAQHDVTSNMMRIHSIIKPKHILGLSATPFRVDRVKLCFDTVIKDAGIPTLIADGYLSAYHHYTIPTWDIETLVKFYVNDVARWGKSIMYFHRLEQCFEAEKQLTDAGIYCAVVHGSSDTEAQINAFRKNELKILLNCMKLGEGFDCPDLKTVFCRPSCKPVTIQMAGRVLRKYPEYEYKQIVQCEKTPYPFQKTAFAKLQHIWTNNDWRTLEVNKHIDAINQRTILAIARTETSMPAFVTKQLTKKGKLRRANAASNDAIGDRANTYHADNSRWVQTTE
jgi:superfamily II DNA or RNA helicase